VISTVERAGQVVAGADTGDDVDEEDRHHGDRDRGEHQLRPGGHGDAEEHRQPDDHQQHYVPAEFG
jgi:hypothetical protein